VTSEEPTVFISWAHRHADMTDDVALAWKEQVIGLAELLQDVCIRAELDEWAPFGTDFQRWGPSMIRQCDFTIIVASKAYREQWDGPNRSNLGLGFGVFEEINELRGAFARNPEQWLRKTIVVLLPGLAETEIPLNISRVVQHFRVDPDSHEGLEELVRRIWNRPRRVRVRQGRPPALPPAPRVTRPATFDEAVEDGEAEPAKGVGELTASPSAVAHLDKVVKGFLVKRPAPKPAQALAEQLSDFFTLIERELLRKAKSGERVYLARLKKTPSGRPQSR
jgi:hypothetical protein